MVTTLIDALQLVDDGTGFVRCRMAAAETNLSDSAPTLLSDVAIHGKMHVSSAIRLPVTGIADVAG